MTNCNECGQEEMAGTMFCSMCGASLIELEGKQAVAAVASEPEPPSLMGQSDNSKLAQSEIVLIIPTSGRRLYLKTTQEIYVGRSSDGSLHNPEINLELDGGGDLGVSRNHAMLKPDEQGGGMVVLDLNSTNGTFLNQYRLPPELPYPLKNGDEVQFGNLLVHVFLR
ncbi:MAG: pSer/pThr/pTyr-binding forkhead associated (FHA) protein [Cellvibrionaceae bacterium]|jgi:pSer/pThr/pTyr-binding forkhead associated (FHA) protein